MGATPPGPSLSGNITGSALKTQYRGARRRLPADRAMHEMLSFDF